MGPIGLHLSLRDTQWGEAVEHVLTDLLCYFVVDNHNVSPFPYLSSPFLLSLFVSFPFFLSHPPPKN